MPNFFANSIELLAGFLNSPAAKAQAYLDPGSGSFILQILIASLVGIGFALRSYWGKLIGLFRKKGSDEEASEDDDLEDEE